MECRQEQINVFVLPIPQMYRLQPITREIAVGTNISAKMNIEREIQEIRKKRQIIDSLNEMFTSINKQINESGEVIVETRELIESWQSSASGANSWKEWIRDDGSGKTAGPESLAEILKHVENIVISSGEAVTATLSNLASMPEQEETEQDDKENESVQQQDVDEPTFSKSPKNSRRSVAKSAAVIKKTLRSRR